MADSAAAEKNADEGYDFPLGYRCHVPDFERFMALNKRSNGPDVETTWDDQAKLFCQQVNPFQQVDLWVATQAERIAIVYEGDEPHDVKTVSFGLLLQETCRVANMYKSYGANKGDRITVYMPVLPETAYVMLASARIGIICSSVLAGSSAADLRDSILDVESRFLATVDEGLRGKKIFKLKETCDVAMMDSPCVTTCFVFKITGGLVAMQDGRDVLANEKVASMHPYCPCEPMNERSLVDFLRMLCPPGSTGTPKVRLLGQGSFSENVRVEGNSCAAEVLTSIERDDAVLVKALTLGSGVVAEARCIRSASMLNVKEKFFEISGIPIREQRLAWGTAILEDTATLEDVEADAGDGHILLTLVRVSTKHILSAGLDSCLQLWDIDNAGASFECSNRTVPPPPDITSDVTCMAVDWIRLRAVCGSQDGAIRIWDLEGGEVEFEFSGHIDGVVNLQTDDRFKRALTRGRNGNVKLWDLATRECFYQTDQQEFAGFMIHNFESPIGVSVTSIRHTTYVWVLYEHHYGHTRAVYRQRKRLEYITCLLVDWESSRILTGGQKGSLVHWSFLGDVGVFNEEVQFPVSTSLDGHEAAVTCAVANWRTHRCVSASKDCTLRLWELGDGRCIAVFDIGRWAVLCMDVDWDSGHAVCGDDSGTLQLWDLEQQSKATILRSHVGSVRCVAIHWPC